MLTSLMLAVLLRSGQFIIEASATIVCGLLTAGIFRTMVGPAGVRRIFGEKGWKGYFRAWIMGMLLPVCSIGVIPVAREMRRSGVPAGTTLAFLLTAPLLNPISFLYGLTLSDPTAIIAFAGISLFLALVLGELFDYFFPTKPIDISIVDAEPMPAFGIKRLLSVMIASARESVGPMFVYGTIGILCSALLSALIPYASLQNTMSHYRDGWVAPWQMTAIALPAYCSPLNGMMKIGLMFDHGNSVGAALVLFVLGIGVNVGLILWVCQCDGWKRGLSWFFVLMVALIPLAYIAEQTLYPGGKEELDHTHAFDEFSSPFHSGVAPAARDVWLKVKEKMGALELVSLATIGLLLLIGLFDRLVLRKTTFDQWVCKQPDTTKPTGKFDIIVPPIVLGVVTLIGLVVFSVYGAYIYYPERTQVLDEMGRVRADVFSGIASGYREDAIRKLELWDLLTRKLQVGVYLRDWSVTNEQAKTAEDFREALEELRDLLMDKKDPEGSLQKARNGVIGDSAVAKAFEALKAAYRQ